MDKIIFYIKFNFQSVAVPLIAIIDSHLLYCIHPIAWCDFAEGFAFRTPTSEVMGFAVYRARHGAHYQLMPLCGLFLFLKDL